MPIGSVNAWCDTMQKTSHHTMLRGLLNLNQGNGKFKVVTVGIYYVVRLLAIECKYMNLCIVV